MQIIIEMKAKVELLLLYVLRALFHAKIHLNTREKERNKFDLTVVAQGQWNK